MLYLPNMYTLKDLEKAQEQLKYWNDKYANDSSNNPNKYQAQIRDASRHLRTIQAALKAEGVIDKTEQERLNESLDKLYPNSPSKRIVTYEGVRYQIKYFPLETSRSRKTVKEWGHNWTKID